MKEQKKHYRKGRFTKIADYLYRYSTTKVYYAVYRLGARMVWKSLKTTDREMANRFLKEELEKSGSIDPRNEKMTLGALIGLYEESLEQYDSKTKANRTSFLKKLKATWKNGFDVLVRDITPAQVELWLAPHRQRMKKVSFNEYIRVVKHLFELALDSKVIAESPAKKFEFLKKEDPDRATPTWEQFQEIVKDIRSQHLSAEAQDSGDLVEFMGLAGIGTAECANILGEHVDIQNERITLYRDKTDTSFSIPIFPQLKELLKAMEKRGRIKSGKPVFLVHDPKKGLAAACKRLRYPHFSPRSLRRCFITRAVEKGVDFKTIAS